MRHAIALVVLAFFVAPWSNAAVCDSKKHPDVTAIFVTPSVKTGSTAEQWVTGFRDRIHDSVPYCIVEDKDKAVMVISVVGMDADVSMNRAAISIAIYTVRDSIFLDHWMYLTDKENLPSSCDKAVAALEKELKELKRLRFVK